ncbi:MFS transporter [Paenibacillus cymbidii]|uniref:MFS transporter n=1 Tax=Paenibacillus cymbidii TaxID=1639034 RepID=UPI001080E128|nr:MFS transporter [Paenibacillus cymbidii]
MKPNEPLYKLGLFMMPNVWRNAKIDIGAASIVSLFNVVINQFYITFAIQQGATHLQVGLLSAAPAFGLLFSPLWAQWVEKARNPLPFVVVPNLIGRLLMLLPAFFPVAGVFLGTSFLYQLLMGINATAYAALVPRMYPADIRGRLLGYVRVAMGCLMIPLAYAVGSWADWSGPSGPLFAAVAAGVTSILLFTRLKLPAAANGESEAGAAIEASAGNGATSAKGAKRFSLRDQWQLVSGNRMLLVFLVATMFSGFGNMLASPLYQIVQVDVLELSNVQIGYARVGYFAGLLLTYFLGGRLIDRFDLKYILFGGIAAYAVVPFLYGAWGTYSAVIAGNAVQGIGEAIWDFGILSFLLRIVPGREATLFGLHLMMFGFRGTLGPLTSTLLTSQVSITSLLLISAAIAAAGSVLFWYGTRKRGALAGG